MAHSSVPSYSHINFPPCWSNLRIGHRVTCNVAEPNFLQENVAGFDVSKNNVEYQSI